MNAAGLFLYGDALQSYLIIVLTGLCVSTECSGKWYNAGVTPLLDSIRGAVRAAIRNIARFLHAATGGRLSPDMVTLAGVVLHIPVAVLIGLGGYDVLAAVLLAVFGLMDTLDGELARLQQRASARGMLLDASTDRMKETIVYAGIAYAFALGPHPATAAFAAAACGASLCVSYVKAKGEAAVASAGKRIPHNELNKVFADGLLTFEVRMALLVVGLLAGQLVIAVVILAVGAGATAIGRLVRISKVL